jgi:hypothetical protein
MIWLARDGLPEHARDREGLLVKDIMKRSLFLSDSNSPCYNVDRYEEAHLPEQSLQAAASELHAVACVFHGVPSR